MPILQANFVISVTESEKNTTETYASIQASEFSIQVPLTFTKLLKAGLQFGGKLFTCVFSDEVIQLSKFMHKTIEACQSYRTNS